MLGDLRVLEISDRPTMLAGQILADLGADVVTVEPPEGAAGRRLEPFVDDIPGLERSLTWQCFNRNKRGITLRYDCSDGAALIAALVGKFDIVLEAAPNGKGAPLQGIALPSSVIHCVATPFSGSGPKASYQAEDLILMAASGAPALAGDPDRPPLFFPVPQAMVEAGAETAVAALAGLAARDKDGLGQDIALSVRIAAMMGALSRVFAGFSGDKLTVRSAVGGIGFSGARAAPIMYACADGYMLMSISLGAGFAATTKQMAKWAIDAGALASEFGDLNWHEVGRANASAPASCGAVIALVDAVTRLCRSRTKAELAAAARRYGFMAAPVMTMADIAHYHQFRERGLFTTVEIAPDNRRIDVPARFIQFSNYRIEIRRPAPRLSEHTAEILAEELNLSLTEVQSLFVHGII
jgi:benzylsuccinate CoA-transferase BbsE subunit